MKLKILNKDTKQRTPGKAYKVKYTKPRILNKTLIKEKVSSEILR